VALSINTRQKKQIGQIREGEKELRMPACSSKRNLGKRKTQRTKNGNLIREEERRSREMIDLNREELKGKVLDGVIVTLGTPSETELGGYLEQTGTKGTQNR